MCAQLQLCSTKVIIGTTIVDDFTDIKHCHLVCQFGDYVCGRSWIYYIDLEVMRFIVCGNSLASSLPQSGLTLVSTK